MILHLIWQCEEDFKGGLLLPTTTLFHRLSSSTANLQPLRRRVLLKWSRSLIPNPLTPKENKPCPNLPNNISPFLHPNIENLSWVYPTYTWQRQAWHYGTAVCKKVWQGALDQHHPVTLRKITPSVHLRPTRTLSNLSTTGAQISLGLYHAPKGRPKKETGKDPNWHPLLQTIIFSLDTASKHNKISLVHINWSSFA